MFPCRGRRRWNPARSFLAELHLDVEGVDLDDSSLFRLACRGIALANLFRGRTGRLGRAERGGIVVFLLGIAAEDDAFAQ
jgi:hypothetical protein